jgi:hypothetical protein
MTRRSRTASTSRRPTIRSEGGLRARRQPVRISRLPSSLAEPQQPAQPRRPGVRGSKSSRCRTRRSQHRPGPARPAPNIHSGAAKAAELIAPGRAERVSIPIHDASHAAGSGDPFRSRKPMTTSMHNTSKQSLPSEGFSSESGCVKTCSGGEVNSRPTGSNAEIGRLCPSR